MSSRERKKTQAGSPMKELVKAGVIRNSSYAMVYHKNLNPDFIDTNIKPMIIPKLICDTVKDEMDDGDKAWSILSVQRTLENLLTARISLVSLPSHLHYMPILCCQLYEMCSGELHKHNNELYKHLLTTSLKLKLQVTAMI